MRLDFSPWGVQAAMHLAQEQGLVQGSQSRRRYPGRPRLRQHHPARQCGPGRCRSGAGRPGRLGARQGRDHPLDRDVPAPHRPLHPRRQGFADEPRSPICAGKTVVVFAASPWAPFIDVYLKSGGLTRDDLKVDVVDPAALWGTYIAKRADGLMSTVGSALPIAEEPRPSKCLLASDANITFPSYGLVAREDTIANKGAGAAPADPGRAARLGAAARQSGRRREGDDRRAAGCRARSGGAARPDQADARLLRHAGHARASRSAGRRRKTGRPR